MIRVQSVLHFFFFGIFNDSDSLLLQLLAASFEFDSFKFDMFGLIIDAGGSYADS